ncbi:hypothetical protein PT179_08730 [Erysipelothrix rhusiopathiae]|nr:hypothetical protein [Erysipelothrix rhusiopathiae]MDE8041101.1 hypothetical protein [Erysipelothrix rhusiopathiae]MDE8042750.1 hypothetical protein [Erysipelothrix rhusiopathiae]MDE8049111.1 hypothetical protein [Erysipelothrix rhusiopathiae]MDE8059023.1 hypothetical protein [Erysipelothrix rhusiopathiae]
MFVETIDEIIDCLDNGTYIAALNLALTMPDICGKAEYPDCSPKVRYIMWFDKYIGRFEIMQNQNLENIHPTMVGEVVYNLRNSLMHEGNPNVNEKTTKINMFKIRIEQSNQFNDYLDTSSVDIINRGEKVINHYSVSLQNLCRKIHSTAKNYYTKNEEKFDFLVDNRVFWDREI